MNDFGFPLTVPFDPNDKVYYKNSLTFKKEMDCAKRIKKDGLRRQGDFFQTRGDYSCES